MLALPLTLAFLLVPRSSSVAEAQHAPVENPVRASAPHATFRAVYVGTYTLEAHFAKPHDTREYGTRLTLLAGTSGRARLDWESWPKGREKDVDVETVLLDGSRVWHKPTAKKSFEEKTGHAADFLRRRVEFVHPQRAIERLRVDQKLVRDRETDAITWTEADRSVRSFAWTPFAPGPSTCARSFAHPRLGDTLEIAEYGKWDTREGVLLPETIVVREFDGEDVVTASPGTFDVRLESLAAHAEPPPEIDVPQADAAAPARNSEPGQLEVEELAPGLISFLARREQGRTYVVEFQDHLVAIDAPLTSELGERIVAAIRARFPSKPLRYVLFGHFHPHYTGGLRAFLAAGATVVAPAGCAKFAEEIAARPFTLVPDAWARAARKAQIESFQGARVFEDATQRLEAIDIGKASKHTDEHVIFHVARAKVIVQDDVGWYAGKDGSVRPAGGARGILDAIQSRKLDVTTLWQSWPVDHAKPSIAREELERITSASR